MSKRPQLLKPQHKLVVISFAAIVLVSIIGMGNQLYIQNQQIATLKSQVAITTSKLSTYSRTLCSIKETNVQTMRDGTYTVQSYGLDRTYIVHTPDNYDPSVRYPVILSFDGIEGTGARMEGYSGLNMLPAIIVYPNSLDGTNKFTSWQGAPYSVNNERDIQFVTDILKELPSRYCTDSTETFAVGMSNGGAFASLVGCELGDQIKAVASVSGAYYHTCKEEQRTPSLLIVHSSSDRQVPFTGSLSRNLPNIQDYAKKQSIDRRCDPEVDTRIVNGVMYENWTGCKSGSTLRFVTVPEQAHGWLAIPKTEPQYADGSAGYIWNFFKDQLYS